MARPKKSEQSLEDQHDTQDFVITDDKIKKFARDINAKVAEKEGPQMAIATLYKQFGEDGGNNKALKLSLKLQGMESLQRQDFLRALDHYNKVLGVYDQDDMFDPVPTLGAPVEHQTDIIH